MSVEEFFAKLLPGWRAHVGHTPFIGTKPKHVKANPFEAYVVNDKLFGTPDYVFASADGKTLIEALDNAMAAATTAITLRDKERKEAKKEKKR